MLPMNVIVFFAPAGVGQNEDDRPHFGDGAAVAHVGTPRRIATIATIGLGALDRSVLPPLLKNAA